MSLDSINTVFVVLLFGFLLMVACCCFAYYYVKRVYIPPEADPHGVTVRLPIRLADDHLEEQIKSRKLVLPSGPFVEQIQTSCIQKRKSLHSRWQDEKDFFPRGWDIESEATREKMMRSIKYEVYRAVSNYVNHDENLFDAICPELQTMRASQVTSSIQKVLSQKVHEPRSSDYKQIHELISAAAKAHGTGKTEQNIMRGFLHNFRTLCIISFLDGLLEEHRVVNKGRGQSGWYKFLQGLQTLILVIFTAVCCHYFQIYAMSVLNSIDSFVVPDA